MKNWNKPEIEEIDVNLTMNGIDENVLEAASQYPPEKFQRITSK